MTEKFQFYKNSSTFHGSVDIVMGTSFDIVIAGNERSVSESAWFEISRELKRLDKLLNRFGEQSEISKINKTAFQESVKISGEIWEILTDCKQFYEKTLGLFDITLQDFSKIEFIENGQSIRFLSSDLHLDLGGYAKGFALKIIDQILRKSEIYQAFVNFGNSSIMGVGHHPYGDSWKVSIKNPFKIRDSVDEICLNDMSMSTSGNTPTYSKHIKNPKSGKFNDAFQLVCVKAKDPVVAEVLSTALMIADENEKGILLKNFEVEETKTYFFR